MNSVQTVTQKQCSESQYTQCIAIHSASSQPLCHNTMTVLWPSYPIGLASSTTIHLGVLQYNGPTNKPPYCNTIFGHCSPMLQYNPSHCTPIAIQFVVLQYNSQPLSLPFAIQNLTNYTPKLQYTSPYCNTIVAYKTRSQYNFIRQ